MLFMLGFTPPVQSVTLAYNPSAGTKLRYRYEMSLDQQMVGGPKGMPNAGFSMTCLQNLEVLNNKNGKITIKFENSDVKLTLPKDSMMASQKDAMAKGMAVKGTFDVDRSGKVIGSKFSGASAMQAQTMSNGIQNAMGGFSLPKGPISVGKTWSTDMDLSKMGGMTGAKVSGKVPIVLKLAEVGTFAGKKAARITFTMNGKFSMSMQGQSFTTQMTGGGSQWMELATGMLLDSTTNQTSTTKFQNINMKQSIRISQKRI